MISICGISVEVRVGNVSQHSGVGGWKEGRWTGFSRMDGWGVYFTLEARVEI